MSPGAGAIVEGLKNIFSFDLRSRYASSIKGRLQIPTKRLHPRKNNPTPGLVHGEVADKVKNPVGLRFQLGVELIQAQDGNQLLSGQTPFGNKILVTVKNIGVNDVQTKILIR